MRFQACLTLTRYLTADRRSQRLNTQPRRPLETDPRVGPRHDRLEEPPLPRGRVQAPALLGRRGQLVKVHVHVQGKPVVGGPHRGPVQVLHEAEVLDALGTAERAGRAVLSGVSVVQVDLTVQVVPVAVARVVAVAEVVHGVVESQRGSR